MPARWAAVNVSCTDERIDVLALGMALSHCRLPSSEKARAIGIRITEPVSERTARSGFATASVRPRLLPTAVIKPSGFAFAPSPPRCGGGTNAQRGTC